MSDGYAYNEYGYIITKRKTISVNWSGASLIDYRLISTRKGEDESYSCLLRGQSVVDKVGKKGKKNNTWQSNGRFSIFFCDSQLRPKM